MTLAAAPALDSPFAWVQRAGLPLIDVRMTHARALFTSRLGGVSGAPYESLNLAQHTGDRSSSVETNRELLLAALGRSGDSVAWARQVHGRGVEQHDRQPKRRFEQAGQRLPDADAQIGLSDAVTPLVLVADCLPVVLAGPSALAVVHCGWRGLADGIIGEVAEAISQHGDRPRDLEAAIGPGIGPCCYEVGQEVVDCFRGRDRPAASMLDLAAIVRADLVEAGLDPARIAHCGLCTSCNPRYFFSHRRDGERTGRQAGLAWLGS